MEKTKYLNNCSWFNEMQIFLLQVMYSKEMPFVILVWKLIDKDRDP